ncbi:MAG: hypothetical protein KF911_11250 [Pseudomonadales bacterium]|nr:hypothetical protein [Pseudomonadales bacterium]
MIVEDEIPTLRIRWGMAHIAFLHTAAIHVSTFDALVDAAAPGTRVEHFVRPDLLAAAQSVGHDLAHLAEHIHAAMRQAAAGGARVVVCTCSTIGAAAEATRTTGRFRALRIDRAMADAAATSGPDVLIVAALESTLRPTRALVEDSARRLGVAVQPRSLIVPDAWHLFEQGDLDAYTNAIADCVRRALPRPNVVVLAQASMAPACERLQDVGVPVLASPALGVAQALQVVRDYAMVALTPAAQPGSLDYSVDRARTK